MGAITSLCSDSYYPMGTVPSDRYYPMVTVPACGV